MGDQVYVLSNSFTIPVEPHGDDLSHGWYSGTFVAYSTSAPVFSPSAMARVVRSDGTGTIAGFLLYGPQHKNPVELQSDMWTTDTRQRSGGDNHYDWTAIDPSITLELDDNIQLKRMGTRLTTMCVASEGIFKFYVYETENKAKRANPAAGADLTYVSGDTLYVSENGLLTNEQETINHTSLGYAVVKVDSDDEGSYVIMCEARIP